jgi:enamine deaminase RidA (YjgF/YER057c/UK114 family)
MSGTADERLEFHNPPELAPPPGYSNVVAVRHGSPVFIAGQVATDAKGSLVGGNDFRAQAEQAFRNLGIALASVGCTARHLAKLTVFVRDMRQIPEYRAARDGFFSTVTPPARPAVTLVEVSRLFADQFLIEIEAVAVVGLPARTGVHNAN